MAFGLDCVVTPPIKALKEHTPPVEFVCRYIGYTDPALSQMKILTLDEAASLSHADIALVSNWEWYANRAIDGHAAGVWDAQEAAKRHAACGGPADRPIYFSVDIDTSGQAALDYFRGVASVIGLSRTGAYGSYRVLHYLFNAGAISWGWQTYAWSYGAWEPRAQIQQYSNGEQLVGHSVDFNRSMANDFGQWGPPMALAGGVETVKITLSNPIVARHFALVSETEWRCVANGNTIKGPLLAFYQTFGSGLCGLTWLGLPQSPEIAYPGTQHGAVMQHFENGVLVLDPAHEFDTRPGDNGPVYLAHIYTGAAVDPRIAQLQGQIAKYQGDITTLEQKISTSPTVSMQAVDPGLQTQIQTLQGQLSGALSRLAQINQLSGVGT